MIRRKIRLVLLLLCLFIFPINSLGETDKIYRQVDAAGTVTYSTTELPNSEPANTLPEIQKENIDNRIKNFLAVVPENCEKHGGIDCQAQADSDGSVICLDGYRDAELPYRFHCLEAFLQIFSFTLSNSENRPITFNPSKPFKNQSPAAGILQVSIRNNSNVEATGIKVFINKTWREKIHALGPEIVKPYEIQDYSFNVQDLKALERNFAINKGTIKIQCINCR